MTSFWSALALVNICSCRRALHSAEQRFLHARQLCRALLHLLPALRGAFSLALELSGCSECLCARLLIRDRRRATRRLMLATLRLLDFEWRRNRCLCARVLSPICAATVVSSSRSSSAIIRSAATCASASRLARRSYSASVCSARMATYSSASLSLRSAARSISLAAACAVCGAMASASLLARVLARSPAPCCCELSDASALWCARCGCSGRWCVVAGTFLQQDLYCRCCSVSYSAYSRRMSY